MGTCDLWKWKPHLLNLNVLVPKAQLLCVKHLHRPPYLTEFFPQSCEIGGTHLTPQSLRGGIWQKRTLLEVTSGIQTHRYLAPEPLCFLPSASSCVGSLHLWLLLPPAVSSRKSPKGEMVGGWAWAYLEVGFSWWSFPSRPLGDHEDACGWHHSDPQRLPTPGGQDHCGGQEAGLPRDHHARSGLPVGQGWVWLVTTIFFSKSQLLPFQLHFFYFSPWR